MLLTQILNVVTVVAFLGVAAAALYGMVELERHERWTARFGSLLLCIGCLWAAATVFVPPVKALPTGHLWVLSVGLALWFVPRVIVKGRQHAERERREVAAAHPGHGLYLAPGAGAKGGEVRSKRA